MSGTGRFRAIVAGASVPLVLGGAAISILLADAASHTAWGRSTGWAANVALVLPGTLLMGAIVAFPLATALVYAMTGLSRRFRQADNPVAWTIAGLLVSLSLALPLARIDIDGRPYGAFLALALGGIGGLAAGLTRPDVRTPGEGTNDRPPEWPGTERPRYGPPAPTSHPAWEAGLRAASSGLPVSACPYTTEPARTMWMEAWSAKTAWFDAA